MDKVTTRREIIKLVAELNRQSRLYYILDKPEVSDAEYDRLYHKLKDLEEQHPELVQPDSPTNRVGDKVSGDFAEITHSKRRMSLDDASIRVSSGQATFSRVTFATSNALPPPTPTTPRQRVCWRTFS